MIQRQIKIGGKAIGKGGEVFVIAEAGVNHNGKLDLALRLVDEAANAGADAVKFQTFKAEQVVTADAEMAEYQKRNIGKKESQLKMLKKLELREEFYRPIINHCQKRGIIFLSTPHGGFESVDLLQKLGVPAFKFGSGDLNNLPVLEYAAKLKKPMILGTGMGTMKEIKEAIKCIKKTGNNKIIVLHTTSNYPCPLEEVNLAAMQTMIKELDVLVGYSDHTVSIQVPTMAVALGACVIEKHFTLDKTLPGPDHKASIDAKELKVMVGGIRDAAVIMGSETKQPNKSELVIMKDVRKSVVAKDNIKKGTVITKNMLGIKRPGMGLKPKHIKRIIGRVAACNIKKDQLINLNFIV